MGGALLPVEVEVEEEVQRAGPAAAKGALAEEVVVAPTGGAAGGAADGARSASAPPNLALQVGREGIVLRQASTCAAKPGR